MCWISYEVQGNIFLALCYVILGNAIIVATFLYLNRWIRMSVVSKMSCEKCVLLCTALDCSLYSCFVYSLTKFIQFSGTATNSMLLLPKKWTPSRWNASKERRWGCLWSLPTTDTLIFQFPSHSIRTQLFLAVENWYERIYEPVLLFLFRWCWRISAFII